MNTIREFFQEENTSIYVPNLGFEWIALDAVYSF